MCPYGNPTPFLFPLLRSWGCPLRYFGGDSQRCFRRASSIQSQVEGSSVRTAEKIIAGDLLAFSIYFPPGSDQGFLNDGRYGRQGAIFHVQNLLGYVSGRLGCRFYFGHFFLSSQPSGSVATSFGVPAQPSVGFCGCPFLIFVVKWPRAGSIVIDRTMNCRMLRETAYCAYPASAGNS